MSGMTRRFNATTTSPSSRPSHRPVPQPPSRRRQGMPGKIRGTLGRVPGEGQVQDRSSPVLTRGPTLGDQKRKSPAITGMYGAFAWRNRWDLNPRWALTHTTFRELHLRPLGHGSGEEFSTRLASVCHGPDESRGDDEKEPHSDHERFDTERVRLETSQRAIRKPEDPDARCARHGDRMPQVVRHGTSE